MIAEKHVIMELTNIAEIVLGTKTIPAFKVNMILTQKMKKANYCNIIRDWASITGDST